MYALNSLHSTNNYALAYADPRLISAAHSGERIRFDEPARDGSVCMKNVPDYRYGYGPNYPSYSAIGGGDVFYYYDSDIGRPFIRPLFDADALVARVDYVDPMGSYKPHYYRQTDKVAGPGLTWLRDSQFQRNDIIASQIWRRNQTTPFYAF